MVISGDENSNTTGGLRATGYDRLEDQIRWFDKMSNECGRNYFIAKIIVILSSAAIPVAALTCPPLIPALLGALVTIAEGIQHVAQWQANRVAYRSTCELLMSEKYKFLERIPPYNNEDSSEARKMLSTNTEAILTGQHLNWLANLDDASKAKIAQSE